MGRESRILVAVVPLPGRMIMMPEDVPQDAAFACCSAGIGRWFWAVWTNEAEAQNQAPVLASGFAKGREAAERAVIERFGPDLRPLASKWASRARQGKGKGEVSAQGERPRSRLSRPVNATKRPPSPPRVAFLYTAEERGRPGEVAVARHRIVSQNARTIRVDRDAFRQDEEAGEDAPDAPKPRTIAIDRSELRREGRAEHRGTVFYASEDDGIRGVHAAMTARHPWCETLGLKFPCSAESVKSAYRRLARATHPDAGGHPAEFRAVEQAYREALAFFEEVPQ